MEVKIGIDMGGTRIKIGLVKNGVVVAGKNIEASSHVTLRQRVDEIAHEADQLLEDNDYTPTGVGIAFPGIVDAKKNCILSKYVKYPDAQSVDLSSWAMERWQIPFMLENDARAALIGEWQYGAGKNCNNLVLITLGTGVGTAALIEGKLLRGSNHLAGNLGGHFSININGIKCNCGHTGCLESEASTWALKQNVRQFPDFPESLLSKEEEINFNAVFKCAETGDKLATKIKEHCLKAWALGIINLILAYDPQRVVIGGGIMKSKVVIIPYIKEMIKNDSWISENTIDLVTAEHVESAGILGMGYLLQQNIKEPRFIL